MKSSHWDLCLMFGVIKWTGHKVACDLIKLTVGKKNNTKTNAYVKLDVYLDKVLPWTRRIPRWWSPVWRGRPAWDGPFLRCAAPPHLFPPAALLPPSRPFAGHLETPQSDNHRWSESGFNWVYMRSSEHIRDLFQFGWWENDDVEKQGRRQRRYLHTDQLSKNKIIFQ